MTNFSIVRIDKKRAVHLQVKPAAWLLERIKTDTKSNDIGGLREYVANYGDTVGYEQRRPIARVYPSVVLSKSESGLLEATAFNGLVTLHVGGLMTADEREAVKSPAVYYFNEYYEIVQNEAEGTWTSATAIYTNLRNKVGAGLKAEGVSVFGRYLKHIHGLRNKRSPGHELYLVREK